MDLVPTETQEPEDNSYLSDRAIYAKQLDRIRPRPRQSKKDRGLQALHDTFELIGGVPRLALHADENPQEFYLLYFKYTQQLEKNVNHTVRVIAPSIPPTALDGDITDIVFEEVKDVPPDNGSAGA